MRHANAAAGPLRVHPANPRYFTDGSGKAVYLTGSHNWDTFQVWFEGNLGAGRPASFTDYLDVLQSHRHNFIRLWVADTAWSPITKEPIEPQPHVRTGPGNAADGRPKFDLSRLNQTYFDELRRRVIAARDRGMYAGLMLFNGWGMGVYPSGPHAHTWKYHPFNRANNVNGIDGDPNGDGVGLKYHSLQVVEVTRLQESYVRKVIDTVNDLDNVLYEISNESGTGSTAWQYHMINYVKTYESKKPEQHPVGMTFQYPDGTDDDLFNSPADWISPRNPALTGSKTAISDTDHFASTSYDWEWPWLCFVQGGNPIVMDWWNGLHWNPVRRAMEHTRSYAERMDLEAVAPQGSLSSTGYCLARHGSEYFVYHRSTGTFMVNLAKGAYSYEWFDPKAGTLAAKGRLSAIGGNQSFDPPFEGPAAVLYLYSEDDQV